MSIWFLSGLFGQQARQPEPAPARKPESRAEAEKRRKIQLGHVIDEISLAIKAADIERVRDLGKQIPALVDVKDMFADVYRRASYVMEFEPEPVTGTPLRQEIQALVRQTVYQDDVALFNAVRNIFAVDSNSRSLWIPWESAKLKSYGWHNDHTLLHFAIHERKPNIALFLANDPATDITYGWDNNRPGSRNFTTPLQLARERDMPEIVLALAKREVALKRQELSALESEIAKLGKTAPPAPVP